MHTFDSWGIYTSDTARKITIFKKVSVGKHVEKRKPLCIDDGNIKWCSHYGEQKKNLKVELLSDAVIYFWIYRVGQK